MILKDKIEDVTDFVVNENSLCYYSGHFKNGKFNFLQFSDWNKILNVEEKYFYLTADENLIYIQNQNPGPIEIYDNDGSHKKTIFGKHYFYLFNKLNENFYFTSETESGQSLTKLSGNDFTITQFCIPNEGFKIILSESELAYHMASTLHKFDYNKGETIWTSEIGHIIFGELKIFKNVLVIPTDDEYLIGINIETGNLLWQLEGSFYFYKQDSMSGLLYGFASTTFGQNKYQVIDPEKGEYLVNKKFDNFFYDVNSRIAVLDNERLYYLTGPLKEGYDRQASFGAIDIKKSEIVLNQQLECKKGVKANMIKCNKDYLFILDSSHTLHIYDKHSE